MAKKETVCYVCAGSCHGVASEEQWKAGAKTCGAKGCELHGKPLKKKGSLRLVFKKLRAE